MRKVRFKYNGTWTRWFNQEEDLSEIHNIPVEAMEIQELMTREKALEYLKRFDSTDPANDPVNWPENIR